MSLPTFQEIWSYYLFNSNIPPKGDMLLDEKLIQNNSQKKQ